MTTEEQKILNDFKDLLFSQLEDKQRLDILSEATQLVCIYCGRYGEGTCYCTRDD